GRGTPGTRQGTGHREKTNEGVGRRSGRTYRRPWKTGGGDSARGEDARGGSFRSREPGRPCPKDGESPKGAGAGARNSNGGARGSPRDPGRSGQRVPVESRGVPEGYFGGREDEGTTRRPGARPRRTGEVAPIRNGIAQGRLGQNGRSHRDGRTTGRSADVGASEPRETRGRFREGPSRDPRGTSRARSGPKGIGWIPKGSRRDTPRAGYESEGDRGCRSRARSWPSGRLGARNVPVDGGS